MKISFKYDKKQAMILSLAFAVALVLYIMTRYPLPILLGFAVGFFLLTAFDFEVSKKGVWPWLFTIPLYILGPLFTTFCIQYTILEPELYKKTKISKWQLNFICVAVVYMVLLAVIGSVRWAWFTTHTLFVIAAFADYFVYEFRQNEITFGDLTTIDTGLSVAKNYDFVLHDRGAVVIMLTALAFILVWKLKIGFKPWWMQHITLRVVAALAAIFLANYIGTHAMGIATQTWEKKGTYRNGFVLNFILGIQDSMIDPPAGYSEEAIKELEEQYSGEAAPNPSSELTTEAATEAESETETEQDTLTQTGGSEAKAKAMAEEVKNGREPTIITIMNESFADFKLVGDLTTNKDVTPFIDSLSENTTRGYALSSVFGAKTPNSEWEYMTGNTMAFLPSGSVVYQQYLDDQPTSIVSTLKNEGYKTVAMHPYFAAGWRRNTVYPKLGFDEQYFMDDENSIFDSTKIYREYITDEEMYKALIEKYEEKDADQPMFVMSITMQNHGGYKDFYPNFNHDVRYSGGYYNDADQYLSLINKTDTATKELIEYFSQVDEPVEIIFFGDHLPSLSNSFFKSLNGKGTSGLTLSELEKLFSVPFFIWTNYDTPENTIERSSLNYLSTMALQTANIELPAYNQFLSDMMEVIPAINSRGYMNAQGKYAHVSDAKGEEKEWINKYNMLQYNRMFDEDNKSYVFSPYIDGLADNANEDDK